MPSRCVARISVLYHCIVRRESVYKVLRREWNDPTLRLTLGSRLELYCTPLCRPSFKEGESFQSSWRERPQSFCFGMGRRGTQRQSGGCVFDKRGTIKAKQIWGSLNSVSWRGQGNIFETNLKNVDENRFTISKNSKDDKQSNKTHILKRHHIISQETFTFSIL